MNLSLQCEPPNSTLPQGKYSQGGVAYELGSAEAGKLRKEPSPD